MPEFDIIITNWNRLSYLKNTIASLMSSGAWNDAQRKIIVDNGSTEEGVHIFLEEMRRLHGIFLVLLPHNRGWGQAVNEALGLSRAEYVFLSNNDVDYKVLDFHKRMFEIFEKQENIGILGVWFHNAHGLVKNGVQSDYFREMDNVPAVGWMLPKRAMERAGMLPEFGVCLTKGGNGEDTEYVNRMKAAGYLVGLPLVDLGVHIDGY